MADNAPVVGADVFTQTSGIHADGDKKANLYQTHLRPERFSRQRSYALGKMSGRASLVKNLERLDIKLGNKDLDKVLKRVVELGDSKKTITAEDLPFIIAEVLESKDFDHIELLVALPPAACIGIDREHPDSDRRRSGAVLRNWQWWLRCLHGGNT